MAHSRYRPTQFMNSAVVVVPGRVRGSFWRIPTDGESYTFDMRYGMRAKNGRIQELSGDHFAAPWPDNYEGKHRSEP